MVKLDKIYTRGGDKGQTSLADSARVAKHGKRITAIGEVDEANAAIGLLRRALTDTEWNAALSRIQNDLFDLGADLAMPGDDPDDGKLRIAAKQVAWLEQVLDRINETLAPLTSFVLPGGSDGAAAAHLARAVARRAERAVVALATDEPVNPQALAYLNRLSDYLFVLARAANDGGRTDVLWIPGEGRKS